MKSTKTTGVPLAVTPYAWTEVDGRTKVYKQYESRCSSLLAALGGKDQLSPQRLSLVRRAVHVEMLIESHELALALGRPIDLGSFTQLSHLLLSYFRTLGLDRKARHGGLANLLNSNSRRERSSDGGEHKEKLG